MKIACMKCKTKMDHKATECPECGYSIKTQKMIGGIIAGVVVFIVILVLGIVFSSPEKIDSKSSDENTDPNRVLLVDRMFDNGYNQDCVSVYLGGGKCKATLDVSILGKNLKEGFLVSMEPGVKYDGLISSPISALVGDERYIFNYKEKCHIKIKIIKMDSKAKVLRFDYSCRLACYVKPGKYKFYEQSGVAMITDKYFDKIMKRSNHK